METIDILVAELLEMARFSNTGNNSLVRVETPDGDHKISHLTRDRWGVIRIVIVEADT